MESFIAHLGGVFIYSTKPEELGNWYKKAFQLDWEYAEEYGAWFITYKYRTISGEAIRYSIFSILKAKEQPKVEGKAFTINLRISDIHALKKHLSNIGIECSEPKDYPDEGLFAWLQDPEGNYIELWQDTVTHETGLN